MRDDAHHGGLIPSELKGLGLDPSQVVDLSANVNPFGPAPEVRAAIHRADLTTYPDPFAQSARQKVAGYAGVSLERIVLGHGATELMWNLLEFISPGKVLNLEPTFSELARAVQAKPEWRLKRVWMGLSMDLGPLAAALDNETRLVFIGHPNNPTGRLLNMAALKPLVMQYPDTYFVLDESFITLSRRPGDAQVTLPSNVIRLRSLTKDHALAGVRIGYAIVPEGWPERLESVRPRWSLSAPALAAVEAAMDAWPYVEECRQKLLSWTDSLTQGLISLGYKTVSSDTIFVLFEVRDASRVRAALLRGSGEVPPIQVRDCSSFGLSNYIRVASRAPEVQAHVLQALDLIQNSSCKNHVGI